MLVGNISGLELSCYGVDLLYGFSENGTTRARISTLRGLSMGWQACGEDLNHALGTLEDLDRLSVTRDCPDQ
jgi:hypothetical protein